MASEDQVAKAESLKEEGIKLFRFGEYDTAASCFDEAHALYVEADSTRGQAEMLNNRGPFTSKRSTGTKRRKRSKRPKRSSSLWKTKTVRPRPWVILEPCIVTRATKKWP